MINKFIYVKIAFFLLFIVCLNYLWLNHSALAEKEPVSVMRMKHEFDITGFYDSGFNQPSDVELYRDQIYVLDGVNDRVAVFDKKGAPLFSFGKSGSKSGEFDSPLGLAIDKLGHIYVADSGNHRIEVFNEMGVFILQFELIKDKYGGAADPVSIAINEKKGYLIISDNDNHRLLIYTTDGKFKREVGEVGYMEGKFRYPFGIDVNSKGSIHVVDVVNTRVQVFDAEGKNVERVIGEWGIERGQFFRPQGIGIDNKDRIFTTESFKNIGVIQVFNPDGSFLAVLANEAGKKLRFQVPVDIDIDNESDRIYICEMYASKISVYKPLDDLN